MNPLFQTEYVVLATVVLCALGGWMAWRSSALCGRRWRIVIVVLRVLALLGLGILALNPGRRERESYGVESGWALMVDRSLSMATPDVDGAARWDKARGLAEKALAMSEWGKRVAVHTFAGELEASSIETLRKQNPEGAATDIVGSGRALLARHRSGIRRLTGMILLSDGRQTRPARVADLAAESRAQQAPIYPVVLGGAAPRRDVSLIATRRQYVAFPGQRVKVGALVRNEGMGPLAIPVTLVDADNHAVAAQKVEVTAGQSLPVQFTLTPGATGYAEYEWRIPATEGEATVANNRTRVGLSVLKNTLRVLVVEGNPGWESKFLVQLLRAQPTMRVTSIYRLSADRFFKVDTDLSQVRESGGSLFPDSPEAMGECDVIVFGKGVEYFLTPERIRLLKVFVTEQGGCVVFSRGKPYGGEFPEIESLEAMTWHESVGVPLRFAPVRKAESAGLFGEWLPAGDDSVWSRLPPVQAVMRCTDLKAFSRVLAEGTLESGGRQMAIPLLISRRVGKGLVLTVNAEGFWQWDFFSGVKEASEIYEELWPQLLLWAATYSEFPPGQDYALRLGESSVEQDVPVTVRVAARSGSSGAPPRVRVLSGATVVQTLDMAAGSGGDRKWAAQVSLGKPGVYRVELVLPDGSIPAVALLEIRAPPAEGDFVGVDRAFLEELARESGGAVIGEDDLPRIVKGLEKADAPEETGRWIWAPLWNRGWVLGVILAVFAAEWVVGRRNGLL